MRDIALCRFPRLFITGDDINLHVPFRPDLPAVQLRDGMCRFSMVVLTGWKASLQHAVYTLSRGAPSIAPQDRDAVFLQNHRKILIRFDLRAVFRVLCPGRALFLLRLLRLGPLPDDQPDCFTGPNFSDSVQRSSTAPSSSPSSPQGSSSFPDPASIPSSRPHP